MSVVVVNVLVAVAVIVVFDVVVDANVVVAVAVIVVFDVLYDVC